MRGAEPSFAPNVWGKVPHKQKAKVGAKMATCTLGKKACRLLCGKSCLSYRNRKPREVEEILCSALRRRPEIEEWIQDERDLLQYQHIGLEVIANVVRAGQFTKKKGGWIHPYTEAA